jgi:outer membrane protein assembly factor BamB
MELRKMNRKLLSSILAISLILSMAITLVALPTSNAHTPAWTIPTWAYLSVMPNPVGVGQTTYIGFWLDKVPPTAYQEYGDRWHNYTVTVTKPDGTTETLGPFTSDAAGGAATTYIPTQLGNYTFVFNYPGETLAGAKPSPLVGTQNPAFVGDYFAPSTSDKVTLNVQQDPISQQPSIPLPTSYWQRPIPAMNLDWYKIAGNWLGYTLGSGGGGSGGGYYNLTANYNPYTTAPNTGHILWTQPYSFGGIMGGEYGGTQYGSNYNSNNQYQPKWGGIIMNGVVYYNLVPGSTTNGAGWVAMDLRTGETLWTKNTTSILRTGQILNIINPNQYGGFPYLWALPPSSYAGTTSGALQLNNTWEMYDAMTGNYILSIVNAPTSRAVISANLSATIAAIPTLISDANGNLIGYYVNGTTLNMWNSTQAIINYNYMTGRSVNSWTWNPPQIANIDWSLGVQWSKPLDTKVTAPNGTSVNISPTLGITKVAGNVLLMTSQPEGFSQWNAGYVIEAAYNLADGSRLWGPIYRELTPWTRTSVVAAADGNAFYEFTMETMSWKAYSLKTGQLLWGPTALNNPSDIYGYYSQSYISAFGGLYMSDLGGYVYALNATTGAKLWTFFTGNAGTETPYGEYPLYNLAVAADGKIYVQGGHLYSPPMYSNSKLYCLNATTGESLWDMPSFVITNQPNCALADGYLLMPNAYDNQLYCFGKGLSATTISAPEITQTLGTSILVKGTVTDQSPGQTAQGIPAKGTPAISDQSMTAWMEYLYMQQPMPTNATGVEVIIEVLDPNNNYYEVGRTTSDASGFYNLAFTPEVPGKYTIVARFAGSESYYSSSAETAINVDNAPVPTSSSTSTTTSSVDQYLLPGIIGIIVTIAIVGAILAVLVMKKKP